MNTSSEFENLAKCFAEGNPSRRDLFRLLKPIFEHKHLNEQTPVEIIGDIKAFPPLTRKEFLSTMAAAGAVLYLDSLPGISKTASKSKQERKSSTVDQAVDQPSLIETIVESTAVTIACVTLQTITAKLGLPFGSASFDKKETKKLIEGFNKDQFLAMGVYAPIWEEGLFRLLPSWILSTLGFTGAAWEVGVPITGIFAAAHNITFKDEDSDKKIAFSTEKIPVGQFILGLFFWKTMRERGFIHSVLAHSTINSEQYFATRLYYNLFPDKRDQDLEKL